MKCRKFPYLNELAALGNLRALRLRRPGGRRPAKMERAAYLCGCGAWHLTSRSQ